MSIRTCLAVSCLAAPAPAWAQQANVALDDNPRKNAENLIPFSASLGTAIRHLLLC